MEQSGQGGAATQGFNPSPAPSVSSNNNAAQTANIRIENLLEECFFLGFIVAFGEFLDFLIPCAVEAAVYGAVVSQGESFTVLAGIETFECVDDWDNVVGVANAAGTFVEKVMLLAG